MTGLFALSEMHRAKPSRNIFISLTSIAIIWTDLVLSTFPFYYEISEVQYKPHDELIIKFCC